MYTEYFGFTKLPFENVPDPAFFFDKGDYARVRSHIDGSLRAGRGLIVVSGPIGSGKTTESQMIIADLSNESKIIWMAEPPEDSNNLFLFIAQELGLKPESTERVFILRDLREKLLQIDSIGEKCLLIIDESHLMNDDVLNGIRLLNNLEEGSKKLLQIFLLGQEELMEKITRPEMENFKQRISTLELLGKMNSDRIRDYVAHRLTVAGGSPSLFTDTGWEALTLAFGSEGIPRVINLLCDRSLNVAYERNKKNVDAHDVYEATKGMKAKTLEKEVFHYIVALKKLDQTSETEPVVEKKAVKGSEPIIEASIKMKADIKEKELKKRPPDLQRPINRPVQPKLDIYEEDRKSLKVPVVFFCLSIIALIASIFFYCYKAESLDIMVCIQELIDSI